MAINFPSAPTLNQVYTYAGKSWKWNGEGWALLTNSLSSLLLNEGSFTVTVAPTTLTGNQTQTVQNATGTVALSSNKLSFFAATTSAELAGVISDETGSGALVFATSPSLTTPTLGVASATSINKVAITAPATSATLAIADGKTFTVSNTLTFTGTDTSSVAFGAGGTVAYAGAGNAFTGTNTFTNSTGQIYRRAATQDGVLLRGRAGGISSYTVELVPTTLSASRTITLADGDTTLQAGTMATTGGTLAQFAATTSLQLAGVISDETGSGALVFAISPSLTTPAIGAATGTSLVATGAAGLLTRAAATQDEVEIIGRAGGTTSLKATITPTTLTASRTITLPDLTGTVALSANNLSFFATTTSAGLAGVISDETGSGALVFATSPTLVTPTLGTPASGNLSNCTNVPAGQLSGTIPSGVLGASSLFIGTTSVALNRGTGILALTGMGTITPNADNASDLGSGALRWANVYTGDLHLKNDRGDYTIIEEEDALTLRNNKTGKVYNFVLQERT